MTRREAMARLDYFSEPRWPPDLVLHSFVTIVPAVGLCAALTPDHAPTREGLCAFIFGWAGHNLIDLATHSSDARPHLWPLSRRRWRSPISYSERGSHALSVLVVDHAVLLALALRVGSRRHSRGRMHACRARVS